MTPPDAHSLLNHFFGAGDSLARKTGVDRAQQLLADRSLGKWKQQSFVNGRGRTLGGGIEFADGLDFIAKEFDAQRTVGLGRIHVENAAAQGVLARHFDHIGRCVADGVEMASNGRYREFRCGEQSAPDRHSSRRNADAAPSRAIGETRMETAPVAIFHRATARSS